MILTITRHITNDDYNDDDEKKNTNRMLYKNLD